MAPDTLNSLDVYNKYQNLTTQADHTCLHKVHSQYECSERNMIMDFCICLAVQMLRFSQGQHKGRERGLQMV